MRARIKGANREVSEGKADSDYGIYSSYDGQQGAANGQGSWGVFSGMNRARWLHQLNASIAWP